MPLKISLVILKMIGDLICINYDIDLSPYYDYLIECQ